MEKTARRTLVPARTGRAVRVARGQYVRIVDLAGQQVGDLFAFATALAAATYTPSDDTATAAATAPTVATATTTPTAGTATASATSSESEAVASGIDPAGRAWDDKPVQLHAGAHIPCPTGESLSASHTRATVSRLFPAVGEAFVTDRRRPILTLVEDHSPGHHDLLIAACDDARYAGLGATDHPSCARNLHGALAEIGLRTDVVPQPLNVFMRVPVLSDGTLGWLPAATAPGDSVTFRAELDCVVVVSACPQDLTVINGSTPTDLAIDVLEALR
ncbi:MAG TPA: urea carboxylase-associated family protein [Kribbella sp.]|nr:urea carboxylase-associated family protein [Kribbella sp.]